APRRSSSSATGSGNGGSADARICWEARSGWMAETTSSSVSFRARRARWSRTTSSSCRRSGRRRGGRGPFSGPRSAACAPASTAELYALHRRLFPLWRASYQDERATWSLMDLKAHVSGEVGTVAGVALAAVGLVWLIACANASNLLTARVASRRRELAVRAA